MGDPLDLSDSEDYGGHEDHHGDYSQRMEELFDDTDDESKDDAEDELTDDEEEGFLYAGVDAEDSSVGYRQQLRDVLEQNEDEEHESNADEMEPSLADSGPRASIDDEEELLQRDDSNSLLHHSSGTASTPPSRVTSPGIQSLKLPRPFLHPTVSRLRSYTPQPSISPANGAVASSSHFTIASPSPSHFSSLSLSSNPRNIQNDQFHEPAHSIDPDVFKWTDLGAITQELYPTPSAKASSVLGTSSAGLPTVLAANGLLCVGTEQGKIYVYDFKQTLRAVCGSDLTAKHGSVTSIALSDDHTCIASGHMTGHIHLYDLKKPNSPFRSVPPVTLSAVSSGRKEGHLEGSCIVSIGFIAGRHTAIVSADEKGLAFFHSLGKLLFVEAPDILRILGRYPDSSLSLKPPARHPPSLVQNDGLKQGPNVRANRYTILAMAPLPLGTPNPTDAYDLVAMLTPTKLVVVGLRPTPKTWFKFPRDPSEGTSRFGCKGVLAWFPSISPTSSRSSEASQAGKQKGWPSESSVAPMLAFTWATSLRLVRVLESKIMGPAKNIKSRGTEMEVGTIGYELMRKWVMEDDIISVQWLNVNQIVVVTSTTLGVYDITLCRLIEQVDFDGMSLSPSNRSTATNASARADTTHIVSHRVRAYKGKIFLLARDRFQVGTLLTWADRILALVQAGDFLKAIDLTRAYYTGEAPGNRNGLPDDPDLRKEVIGEKMKSLMNASTLWAFSEDRMADETHLTPDGRGVDRTSLFEALVTICCRACIALSDFEFLFEDLFQKYDDAGITTIYLRGLEPFVLDNEIRHVPPRITQRLIHLHEEDGQPEHVERIIWHMDPSCLDLNQVIRLCQKYHLYDALIYIYIRALQDYVAPVVELLGLVRRVQQYEKARTKAFEEQGSILDDYTIEPITANAYKVYPYLANILSGLIYPSEEPLSALDAVKAKDDVYTFLFFGRSNVWPPGENGQLVLTSDEEGGPEPTYPYARQLLRFDSESFLHSLDIAFEDAFLNEESRNINRLIIVRILLEILASGDLPPKDVTFVNIFIARNVPKYPQFLQVAPSVLHAILVSLAEDPDSGTREDRQLAVEYLLSVYNPHESDRFFALFKDAGFYRILRSWYRQERRWPQLLSTYFDDPQFPTSDVLEKANEVLSLSCRSNKSVVPIGLAGTISDALPKLLRASIRGTAIVLEEYLPQLHQQALDSLNLTDDDHQGQFEYLNCLLGPLGGNDEGFATHHRSEKSDNLKNLPKLFIALQCQLHPEGVIELLQYLPSEKLDWTQVFQTCEANEVLDAAVWTTNKIGGPREALVQAASYQQRLTLQIAQALVENSLRNTQHPLANLQAVGRIGTAICLEHSQGPSTNEVSSEDLWFLLLSRQIQTVQLLADLQPSKDWDSQCTTRNDLEYVLSSTRSLVQETFGALVSITSTRAVSFPRLFKRLVNSAPTSTGNHYTEFRIVLGGMLDSYRSDGDMLVMTKHLVDSDLFDVIAAHQRERNRGWSPQRGICSTCRKPLANTENPIPALSHDPSIVAFRSGAISHRRCLPVG